MKRPVRTKWHYNEVEYLTAVLHGMHTKMTSSHLIAKDKKDVNPKLITPELGDDNRNRESHYAENYDCERRGLKNA